MNQSPTIHTPCSGLLQMGANIKEFFSLVENFIDMIGRQMRDFQDIYEVTENLGECGTSHVTEEERYLCLCVFDCCFLIVSSELSIQKRPRTMTADVTFPLKGWRGMIDWVRNSEEKITVSRNALSLDVPGTHTLAHTHSLTHTLTPV